MANYIKRGNTIFIPDSTKLTEQDKADIALYRGFGYDVSITRAKQPHDPKGGYKKVELIYFLEEKAPADKVKEFTKATDEKGYLNGLNKVFKVWYKETFKEDYSGQAADLIAADGKKAEDRIKELNKIEDDKRKAKKAAKKKANK